MHAPIKYFEKGLSHRRQRRLGRCSTRLNRISQNPSFTPKWSDKPLLKSLSEDQAAARLAARDRLALPDLRARGAAGRSSTARRTVSVLLNEKVGEIKAHDHRARRQDPDGEGLPASTATSKT